MNSAGVPGGGTENTQVPETPFFRGFSPAQGPRCPKTVQEAVGSVPASVTKDSLAPVGSASSGTASSGRGSLLLKGVKAEAHSQRSHVVPDRIRPTAGAIPMNATRKLMESLCSPSSCLVPAGVRPECPPSPRTNQAF